MTNGTSRTAGDSRTAAFLLIIPGCLGIGVGLGMFLSNLFAGAITGVGVGFLAWGLIVAFRRSATSE
jgi:hypothetical protein